MYGVENEKQEEWGLDQSASSQFDQTHEIEGEKGPSTQPITDVSNQNFLQDVGEIDEDFNFKKKLTKSRKKIITTPSSPD